MRMVRPRVDLQLSELLATEPVARQHPLDRQPQHFLRAARDHLLERPRAQSARVAAVAVVALLLALVAGHRDLLGVDHDHEVADVAVRRVLRLALPAEHVGNLRREAAERLARRVDDEPVALAGCWCGYEGLHGRVAARTRLAGALPAPARVVPRRGILTQAPGERPPGERSIRPTAGLYSRPIASLPSPSGRTRGSGGTSRRHCPRQWVAFGGESSSASCCAPRSAALSARARQLTP